MPCERSRDVTSLGYEVMRPHAIIREIVAAAADDTNASRGGPAIA
jgi:hypothetical protein